MQGLTIACAIELQPMGKPQGQESAAPLSRQGGVLERQALRLYQPCRAGNCRRACPEISPNRARSSGCGLGWAAQWGESMWCGRCKACRAGPARAAAKEAPEGGASAAGRRPGGAECSHGAEPHQTQRRPTGTLERQCVLRHGPKEHSGTSGVSPNNGAACWHVMTLAALRLNVPECVFMHMYVPDFSAVRCT